jgi:hypothetical protein
MEKSRTPRIREFCLVIGSVSGLLACSPDASSGSGAARPVSAPSASSPTTIATPPTAANNSARPPGSAGGGATSSQTTTPGVNPTTPPAGTGTLPPTAATTPPPTTTPTVPAQPMQPFNGPLDGDPSKPMVDIPGLKCGPLAGGFGAAPQTVKITNRDVVIGYPCAHEGAAVTFFLFLHGTLQEEQKVSFTMNAFAIHKLIDSHNVVMAVPKAVGTQWGNGDNGADLPHLYDVIDWIYTTFGQKFSIRSMWSQGGSWGAAYLANFACDPKLQDRLKGIQLIVGGGCPRCSDRLSCIVGQQELQLGMDMMLTPEQREMYADQSNIAPYATKHGCMPKMGPTDVGNVKYWVWPQCQPGWAHSYYMAPGQHADAWDMAAVLKMTEEMKATEN